MANQNSAATVNPFAIGEAASGRGDKPCSVSGSLSADGTLDMVSNLGPIAAQLAGGFDHVPAEVNSNGNKGLAYGQKRFAMPDGSVVMAALTVTLIAPKRK